MTRRVDHPLVKLVKAGGKLDFNVMGWLMANFERTYWGYSSGTHVDAARYAKETVEALIANLNQNTQEDCVKSGLLEFALEMRSSAAIELVKNNVHFIR